MTMSSKMSFIQVGIIPHHLAPSPHYATLRLRLVHPCVRRLYEIAVDTSIYTSVCKCILCLWKFQTSDDVLPID